MKYLNELCQPWCELHPAEQEALLKLCKTDVEYMDSNGKWFRCGNIPFKDGIIYRAPMPAEQEEVPLEMSDIKQGDNFRARKRPDFIMSYSAYDLIGIQFGSFFHGYRDLMDAGWEIRSIGETEWRPCSKKVDV